MQHLTSMIDVAQIGSGTYIHFSKTTDGNLAVSITVSRADANHAVMATPEQAVGLIRTLIQAFMVPDTPQVVVEPGDRRESLQCRVHGGFECDHVPVDAVEQPQI